MKYFWTRGQHSYLSNQYYRSLAGGISANTPGQDFAIQWLPNLKDPNSRPKVYGGDRFALIGTRHSQPAEVSWTAHGRGWFKSGGPFSWRRNLDMCFDGQIGHSGLDKLIKNPNNPYSTAAHVWDKCWNPTLQQVGSAWTCDQDCLTGPDFVDEVMLSPDMGLMWKFQVNKKTGRPHQIGRSKDGTSLCTGINEKTWRKSKDRSESNTVKCHTEARANTASDVEDFARDQSMWATEFGAVFEKMLDNGQTGLTTHSNYECCK